MHQIFSALGLEGTSFERSELNSNGHGYSVTRGFVKKMPNVVQKLPKMEPYLIGFFTLGNWEFKDKMLGLFSWIAAIV
jgi:hypothetical protein